MHRAREKGRASLEESVDVLRAGLKAMKPVFIHATDGQGNTASVPGEDVPDLAERRRCAAELCDRFGLPKKIDVEASDPWTEFLLRIAEQVKK